MKHLTNYRNKSLLPTFCLLGAGVVALVFGLVRGEVTTVLTKAIYICLECIGIG